jgi:hypothetical protein
MNYDWTTKRGRDMAITGEGGVNRVCVNGNSLQSKRGCHALHIHSSLKAKDRCHVLKFPDFSRVD